MLKGKDIILISTMDWDESVQIMHQMALRLSRNNRVLYIGRQFSLEHLIKHPSYFKWLWKSFKGIYKIKENLWAKSPFLVKPARYYFRFMDSISQLMMRIRIKRWIQKIGFKNPIIWCFFPNSGKLPGKFNEELFIYHCVDCFSANSKGWKRRIINEIEKELVRKSGLVIGTSRKIYESKKTLNSKTFYIPNACETELFQEVQNPTLKIHPSISEIKGTKFLHLGYMNAKTNLKMLFDIFTRNPDWNFIQIGDVLKKDFNSRDLHRFKTLPNTYFLGFINQADLPQYIKGCDACLIPVFKNEWTDCVSPLKFFEYAATGIPIITTGIREVLEYKDICLIASSENHFEELMRSITEKNFSWNPEPQISFSKQHNWDIRFHEIINIIDDVL